MWHEARKQERKIRGLMVDYKKRADRRKEFYEKIVSYLIFTIFTINYFTVHCFLWNKFDLGGVGSCWSPIQPVCCNQ